MGWKNLKRARFGRTDLTRATVGWKDFMRA